MTIHDDPSAAPETGPSDPRRRPRRVRPMRWLLVVVGLTAAYWIASYGARPTAESWLSRTLGVPVKIVRVGFDPIDAVFTFEGVVSRLPSDGESIGQPILADRARVDLQWFPLVHRRLQIREFVLEGAVVELERAPHLAPALETLWAPSRPATLPEGWSVQVDRVVLRDSVLRLRGFGPETKPLEVSVHEAEVTATRRRTSVLGAATNLRLDASFEGGNLRAEGHYSLRDEGLAVMADVSAADVPVARVLQRLPQIDDEYVSGRLDAEMRYVLEPQRRNVLSGWARLREAKIRLPESERPAVEVRNAIADIAALDLAGRDIRVRSLVLRGATLQPESRIGSTLLSSLQEDDAPRALRRRRRSDGTSRWRWAVDRFDASDARLRIPGPTAPMDVVATIRGQNLGPRSHWSPVHARFVHGLGNAEFEGSVRTSYDEPRLEGRLSVGGLHLPTLAHEVALPGAHLIRDGRVTANIDVLLEPGSAGFGLKGLISVTGASLAGRPPARPDGPAPQPGGPEMSPPSQALSVHADAPDNVGPSRVVTLEPLDIFEIGADRVDLAVDAPAPARRPRGPEPPRRWSVDATFTRPYVYVSRGESGWVLPSLDREETDETAGREDPQSASGAGAPAPERDPEPISLEEFLRPITLRRLAVVGGRIRLNDRADVPGLTFDVREIGGTAHNVTLIPFEAEEIDVQGYGANLGFVELRGHEASKWSGLEIAAEEIPLYLTGPYLQRLRIPYRFSGGTGSFVAAMRLDPDGWTADTLLVLNRPIVEPWTDDGAAVPDRLGMTLSSAFRLLRDQSGDVRVRLPRLTALDEEFDLAVYEAIENAHQSPSSGGALTPTTIEFAPGRATLDPNATARLRSIARLVGSQPLLRIELAAPASLQDRRWLAERALLEALDDRGGLMGALRIFGATDEKERIREALQARTEGGTGYLSAPEEERLDEMLARQPPPSAARLRALAGQRLAAVERLFVQQGISPTRLARREIGGQDRTTLAAVLVTVRAKTRPMPRHLPLPPEDGV